LKQKKSEEGGEKEEKTGSGSEKYIFPYYKYQ